MTELSTRKAVFGKEPPDKTDSSKFRRSLAIVIGIDNYSNGIPSLATAVNDARELARILEDKHKYEVILLIDEEATLPRLKEVFTKDIPEKLAKNDRLLVYFAGHGVALDCDKGPEGYLIPQDARREDKNTFWKMTELHEALEALSCRHMLAILDCCFAGAFRWSSKRDFQPLPPVIYKERYERFIRSSAWQVITSAAYDQTALDILSGNARGEQGVAHSPFALSLFEALHGAADSTPKEGDGVITATELYLYLRDEVEIPAEKLADHRQSPGLWPLNKHEHGEFIFLVPEYGELDLPPAPDLTKENNPYKGLSPYEKGDSKLFFGRKALVKKLKRRVAKLPFTVVLGASGTGKSSLVKAGLLPALEKDAESAKEQWFIPEEVMRPGANPAAKLRSLLIKELPGVRPEREEGSTAAGLIGQWRKKNPGRKLLLVIDQFEELITLCREEQVRESFIRELRQALEKHSKVLRIVLTLRSDFEAQISQNYLKDCRQRNKRFVVPPMTQDELREVIEKPASEMVLYFEPHELIDDLINEVISTPGALPLLSFTLSELYLRYVERQKDVERQDGNRALTEADYKEIGGVIGSLRRRIDQEYEQLDAAHQATMKRIMLRMIAFEGGELTRRRVPDWELDYPDAAENERRKKVVDILFQARLIVTGSSENAGGKTESYIEPAHDALIVAWEKLLKWRAEEEEAMLLQRQLTRAAADWEGSAGEKEKKGLLWDNNPRLVRAQEILELKWSRGTRVTAGHGMFRGVKQFCRVFFPSFKHLEQHIWLNRVETDFIRRSVERKRNWTRRGVAFISAVVVALATAWWRTNNARIEAENQGKIAITQKNLAEKKTIEAEQERDRAEKKRLEANYNLAKVFEEKSISSLNEAKSDHSNKLYQQAILSAYANLNQDISNENKSLSRESAVRIFHPEVFNNALSELYLIKNQDAVSGIVFNHDSTIIASAGDKVRIWDAMTGAAISSLSKHEGWVFSVAFSPDGTKLASASSDKTVRIWDAKTYQELAVLSEHTDSVNSVAFSPDNTRLASASSDKTVRIWDAKTYQELAVLSEHTDSVNSVAFSSDNTRLASASSDKIVRIWDVKTGNKLAVLNHEQSIFLTAHPTVLDVVFSPDGTKLASASIDSIIRIWDAKTYQEVDILRGHADSVSSVAFSPDGTRLASASWDRDKTVRLWNIKEGKQIAVFRGHEDDIMIADSDYYRTDITSIAFSPDGLRLASASTNKIIRIWDGAIGTKMQTLSPKGSDGAISSFRGYDGNSRQGPYYLFLESNLRYTPLYITFMEGVKFLWQVNLDGFKFVQTHRRNRSDMEKFGVLLAPPPPGKNKFDQVLEWAEKQQASNPTD